MKKEQRHQAILRYIEEHQRASVTELAEVFHVAPMTIRRDLDMIEQTDLIQRVRGGAIGREIVLTEKEFDQRKVERIEEKRRIGQKALEMIQENDSILLDYGSTPQELAKLMAHQIDFPIEVVINDFYIYQLLRKNPYIYLHFVGGSVEYELDYITLGPMTSLFYKNLSIDKAFMSMRTIDLDRGLFHPDSRVADLKRHMIQSSKKVIVIADHSKFNNYSMFKIASMDQVDAIITDTGFNMTKNPLPESIQWVLA